MKKLFSLLSVVLALILVISSLPMAMAQTAFEYDNSVWVTLEAEQTYLVEELSSLLQVDRCFVMDKQTKEGKITYQLVVMDPEESVADTIERMKGVEGVTNAGKNVYAPDYASKESYLTLNQTEVVIPVGGTTTLKLTDAHLVFDEKQTVGIVVSVDHQALPFEQFRTMVTAMGNEESGEAIFFYALNKEDYDWEQEKQYLFLGAWGSDEYKLRQNKESSIGKYLIDKSWGLFISTEQMLQQLAENPQITDVRIAYDHAPGGIPSHEEWTVEDSKIVGLANDAQDKSDQFYTVTVVGRTVGQTVITVKHGEGTRICYATCTVTVVEANPESPTDVVFGDPTGDRKVDAKDALQVLKYAVQKAEFTPLQMLAAEVDGKDGINAKDALEILKYSVQKIDKFPIEESTVTPTDVTPTDK